jgi:hypothetical protein
MKQELKIDDILLQCSNALTSFIFIELSNSLAGEDLTTPPSSTKSLKGNFQFGYSLSSEPSTLVGRIQSVVSYLHTMVLPRQTSNELWTLDYDKILL